MVEVLVSVEDGGVYIVGQTIHCTIEIHNNTDSTDRIAWATGQISGHVTVDDRYVRLKTGHSDDILASSSALSKHVGDGCFYSSDPQILFCDLQLPASQSKILKFSAMVPTDSPPSYRGSYVKYSYMVLIGLQRVGQPVSFINLPIRIINLPGISQGKSSERPREHPFAPRDENLDYKDYFMDKVQSLCCKRSLSFEVKSKEGLVSVVRITKGAYRLGDPIDIHLEFGDVTCVQVTLKLQVLETVSPENEISPNTDTRITTHDTQTLQCLHQKQTSTSLHIPLNVVNSFSTNIVLIRWQVHFEFVVAHVKKSPDIIDSGVINISDTDCSWKPLETLPVSTLSWEMPVRIVPTLPKYIATIAWQRTQARTIL